MINNAAPLKLADGFSRALKHSQPRRLVKQLRVAKGNGAQLGATVVADPINDPLNVRRCGMRREAAHFREFPGIVVTRIDRNAIRRHAVRPSVGIVHRLASWSAIVSEAAPVAQEGGAA